MKPGGFLTLRKESVQGALAPESIGTMTSSSLVIGLDISITQNFLKGVEVDGGLGKVKNLAIHEDVLVRHNGYTCGVGRIQPLLTNGGDPAARSGASDHRG